MAKINRSVRWNYESYDLVEKYIIFLRDVLGVKTSFSEIANNAMNVYLYQKISEYNEWLHNKQIIIQTEDGKIRKLNFTTEQIEEIERLKAIAETITNAEMW